MGINMSDGMEHNKPFLAPYVLIALALIGLGVTAYLSYYQYLNLVPGCAIDGCEIVLTSAYSHVFGVPLSYIGFVYYVYFLCLAVLLAIEPRSLALSLGALLYALVGVGLSAYFEFYIQLHLIGALCLYCAMSAATTLLLFLVAAYHFRSRRA